MKRRYPSYRSSGIESLGELPAHWETSALGRAATYIASSVDKKSDPEEIPVRLCNYTDVYYGDRIRASDGDFMAATATAQEIGRCGLHEGDVLITKDSEDWQDIAVPAIVEESAEDFVCGYHLGIVRPSSKADPTFLYRCLQSDGVNQQLQVTATGVTRYGLSNSSLEMALIPLPPLSEQIAIGEYLNREVARIDSLIAKQHGLIERLDEYRSALVTHTVTQGLPSTTAAAVGVDPEPRMKPSGVQWLRDVPEHWEVRSFRYVCRLAYGDSLPGDERAEGDVPVFGSNGVVGSHDVANTLAPAIIVGRKGSHGKVNLAKQPSFSIDTTFYIDERSSDADLGWLYYVLSSAGLDDVSQDSAVPGLSRDDAYAKYLPHPPLAEQAAIARFLDSKTELVEDTISNAESCIERLYEFRIAMISAAVTGKIDVRDAASSASGVSA